ncbi:MAG TPA: helix-turn-helix domain-containing protein [Mogibacterium sp.]|nr:helix-turn-helix domain-containing protein [Mogibacterium sp.]
MSFKNQLNHFIDELGISGSELAKISGISVSSISRYRNGKRIPKPDSDVIKILAESLEKIAKHRNFPGYDKDVLSSSMNQSLLSGLDNFDYNILYKNFDSLITIFNISMQNLAEYLNYDVSHIYRIRKGERKPSNPFNFVQNMSDYIIRTYRDAGSRRILMSMLNYKYNPKSPPNDKIIDDALFRRLCHWMTTSSEYDNLLNDGMFTPIKDFDINSLSKDRFLKNQTRAPKIIKRQEEYVGIEGFANAMADFTFNFSFENSNEDITVYNTFLFHSNHDSGMDPYPLMHSILKVLDKGIKFNLIHDVDHDLKFMLYDYRFWLPLYLSGKFHSFCMEKSHEDSPFRQFIVTTKNLAFIGNAVVGFEKQARFIITKNPAEVEYYSNINRMLLKKAKPLVDIYTAERESEFHALIDKMISSVVYRRAYLSTPPLHTISYELLDKILDRSETTPEESEKIRNYILVVKKRITKLLSSAKITEFLPLFSEEDIQKRPPALFLADIFPEKSISYTYSEYQQHLAETIEFADNNENYSLVYLDPPIFKNTRIIVHQDIGVLVSSNKVPSSHLVITHPKMYRLIERIPIFTKAP